MSKFPSRGASGFTLVEMLVALAVFALLAAAGTGILRASVDTQRGVEEKLTALGQVGRLHALLTADLTQAVDRTTRAPSGQRPAFEGDAAGMSFVRAGWSNLDGAPRSDLQRVTWRLDNRQLSRSAFAPIDGDDQRQSTAALLKTVANASFRYRMKDGSWSSAFRSTPVQPLPTAVEISVAGPGRPMTVMMFALGQSGAAQPIPA